MHIPDGYLSPSTCAVTFAAAAPFVYVASQKVKRQLHTRAVPLMAVVSAFSFVVMMFNLPLPGGTTGHAVGLGIAAIVLGPWAAVLAVSVALLIQAVFFGDGGILALGANVLNMAVLGPFTACWLYRMIAGDAAVTSPRRIVAGFVAGYAGINVAAFATAIEFGVQPMLFHDASGAPLYAPYPLSIAIPAMMLGHLAIAGLAEGLTTAGIIAVLQRHEPELLQPAAEAGGAAKLWAGLAALMLLTPLGLLAAGTAWGEWGVDDFPHPDGVPAGLRALAGIWTAPIPDYAPAFMHNESFGYVLSAAAGSALIWLAFRGVGMLRRRAAR